MDDPREPDTAGVPEGTPAAAGPAGDRTAGTDGTDGTFDLDGVAADIDSIEALLDGVDRALSRIDAATYGRCGTCGGPIEDAVLAEDPTREHCGGCRPPVGAPVSSPGVG